MTRKFRIAFYEKTLDPQISLRDVLPPDHLARFIVVTLRNSISICSQTVAINHFHNVAQFRLALNTALPPPFRQGLLIPGATAVTPDRATGQAHQHIPAFVTASLKE